MRNDLRRAERRWQKKSLFHRHEIHDWWYVMVWLLLIVMILLVVALFMQPSLLKQLIHWAGQLLQSTN